MKIKQVINLCLRKYLNTCFLKYNKQSIGLSFKLKNNNFNNFDKRFDIDIYLHTAVKRIFKYFYVQYDR